MAESILVPRRWPISRLASRNPLVRASDRFEALAHWIAVIFAVIAIPLAVSVGQHIHSSLLETQARQTAAVHTVQATANEKSSSLLTPDGGDSMVEARWSYNSVAHVQSVHVDSAVDTGEQFPLYVDDEGKPSTEPMTSADAMANTVLVATTFYVGAITASILFVMAAGWMLGRFRRHAWDLELAQLTDSGDGWARRDS
ncbi:hypothetical protein AAFP30_11645 [Gordonia sp. CPCC 205515]|uniref:Rv1733c family protein n=1 Tax=Gordonia sp. CPCC 205515 TaxID=3140791 RepID=UPI003AF3D651